MRIEALLSAVIQATSESWLISSMAFWAQTVDALAQPAADILEKYHSSGRRAGIADLAGRYVPLVGNFAQGKIDPDYQNAHNAALTLSTQYLEVMPKSRFQPSTIAEIMKQIDPNPQDADQLKATKLARVKVLRAAIHARATNAQGPEHDLNDIPPPPE